MSRAYPLHNGSNGVEVPSRVTELGAGMPQASNGSLSVGAPSQRVETPSNLVLRSVHVFIIAGDESDGPPSMIGSGAKDAWS